MKVPPAMPAPLRRLAAALLVAFAAACWPAGAGDHAGPARAEEAAAAAPLAEDRVFVHTAFGVHAFSVEIADEPAERARGLMFRETMAPDHGMLFIFGDSRPVSMWMKNTPMSLDMVFLRPDGTVATIAERTEPFSETVIDSGEPVSHVLELRAGIARMIGLKPGDRLDHPSFAR